MTARMNVTDALTALYEARDERDVIITTMGAAREWMALQAARGANPRDLVFVPSSMGQATSFALGIALAQPNRRIIVCNGDGSMLMNLGSLVSIAAAAPRNLGVLLLDNGVYEVTGAQPTPAAMIERAGGRVDYEAMARASGFTRVFRFREIENWRAKMHDVLCADGLTFALLDVEPVHGRPGPKSPGPAAERARQFMAALGATG